MFHACHCFGRCRIHCACHANFQSGPVRDRQFLTLLTCECAWRHNGMQFSGFSTSKSGLNLYFLSIFTSTCASCHSRATTAPLAILTYFDLTFFSQQLHTPFRHISTSQLPKVSRSCGLQFLISHLSTWLRARGFSTFLIIFARLHLLSADFFLSFDVLSSFLFSDSSHFCFCICPYCRKFDF